MDKLLILSYGGEFYIRYASLLASRKISVKLVMTIQDALEMLSQDDYFTIVVDITYPEYINMIKALRQSSFVPIIAYSEEYCLNNNVISLRNGADEYFVDSGEIEDIFASIKALRRRYCEYGKQKENKPNNLTHDDITICINTRRVFVGNTDVGLNKKEFDTLFYLIKNKGKVLSYEQIFCEIWGGMFQRQQINAVRCLIHRLSEKINSPKSPQNYIVNIKDYGYRINPIIFTKNDEPAIEDAKAQQIILAVGYEHEELLKMESLVRVVRFQKTDTIHDAIKMINTEKYELITINGNKNDYLFYIKLIREMILTPILVTTNTYEMYKKAAAIDNGADGYMPIKEYDEGSIEIIKALIRRAEEYKSEEQEVAPVISFGDILLDLSARKTMVADRYINLTCKEFDILKYIVHKNGEIVTYEQICEQVWGEKYHHGTYKPVMRMIYRIKEKIKAVKVTPEYILNIREIGYRLNTEFDR